MGSALKSYPPKWNGRLLLACRKCQKKLKGQHGMRVLAKLKKTIRRRNKQSPETALHLMNVPCMGLCPKGAVTICLPVTATAGLSVLRSEAELDELYRRQ